MHKYNVRLEWEELQKVLLVKIDMILLIQVYILVLVHLKLQVLENKDFIDLIVHLLQIKCLVHKVHIQTKLI